MGNGTPEHRELEAKGNTVNGVILSEADYLDQIRIPDYSMLMKNYLKSRGWFSRVRSLIQHVLVRSNIEVDQRYLNGLKSPTSLENR